MTEWIDAVRVALALAGLLAATVTDLKSREVPDELWFGLAAAALALMAADFAATFGGMAWILVVPVGLIFVLAVTGGEIFPVFPGDSIPEGDVVLTPAQERTWRLDQRLSLVLLAAAVGTFLVAPRLDLGARGNILSGPEATAYSVAFMVAAGLLFYLTGALHGGADAKGFMALALLFPVFPHLPVAPLFPPSATAMIVVPFALAVLFNGALLLVLGGPVAFMLRGLARRRVKFPESLFGYEKGVAEINLDREFLLGRVVEGAWQRKLFVSRGSHSDRAQQDAIAFLKAQGVERVFVSPKVPFMVNLLAGLVLALFVTCPLYWV